MKELAKQIHENAKSKGFYEAPFNYAEKIMLMVCELSESIEANRIDKKADLKGFKQRYDELVASMNWDIVKPENAESCKNEFFIACFKKYIKDSQEDELADTIIRILDLVAYLDINIDEHIALKIKYNSLREYKHGKNY